MASFWREHQLVWTKKKLKTELIFGEPECKLGSKVVLFLFFALFHTFLKPENGIMLQIEDIVEST
jgi:hypothetical protein